MKPLHWDAINPATGTPFLWDDPNLKFVNGQGVYLEPGDEGYVPYANALPLPKPKKKPFHRKPRTTGHPATSTMSTFKYNVVPKAGSGFSTRALLGEEFDDATIDNAVAAATGLTAAQCLAVLQGYFTQFTGRAADCGWSHDFHGLLSIRPTSGGSSTTPDGFNNADDINANIAFAFSPVLRESWKSGLTIESQGLLGLLTPEIDSIINLANGVQDTYTTGEILQLKGDNLGFAKTDPAQGVFYTTAAAPGTKVRISSYGTITDTEVNAIMPAGLTGALRIYVVKRISNSLREGLYVNPIG